MNLDLNAWLSGWECPREEVFARLVRGRDGAELVQLRIDLGLLQMHLDGRPDGGSYRGLPSAFDYLLGERSADAELTQEDWRELHRELHQYNYRRLALSSLAEAAFQQENWEQARLCLTRALRDIERCLGTLRRLEANTEEWDEALATLWPTLVFNRARLLIKLRASEHRYEEAIERAQAGAAELEQALTQLGLDEEQREQDPGIAYLRQIADRLREQHGIKRTLREQLEDAIAQENFEDAARLRDTLRRRGQQDANSPSPMQDTHSD